MPGRLRSTYSLALPGWRQHIHPEGLLYYHHVSRHVLTEANLRKPELLHKINYWMGEFDKARDRTSFEFPETYELVLELDLEEQGCSYYLVDHDRHTVFYLDDTNTGQLDLPDVCSLDHLSM